MLRKQPQVYLWSMQDNVQREQEGHAIWVLKTPRESLWVALMVGRE